MKQIENPYNTVKTYGMDRTRKKNSQKQKKSEFPHDRNATAFIEIYKSGKAKKRKPQAIYCIRETAFLFFAQLMPN